MTWGRGTLAASLERKNNKKNEAVFEKKNPPFLKTQISTI